MSENQDTLDGSTPNNAGTVPSFLNVICILSYIGKGLLALLFLIAAFASTWFMSMFMGVKDQAMSNMEALEGMEGMDDLSAAQMEQASSAFDSIASMGTGLFMGVFLFLALLQILALIGVARMHKLKKSGFVLYMIGNGLFAILMIFALMGGSILLPLLTFAFIVMYILNRKHLVH